MIPRNSKRVSSVRQLQKYFKDGLGMFHVAVQRTMDYYHHYVVLAEESNWESFLTVVQYTGGVSHFLTGSTAGQVEKTKISISKVRGEIRSGMYIITGTNYPQSAIDFVEACSRYLTRLGERAYHVAYNNCEHLANYIMSGFPDCEQINKCNPFKKALADTVDMAVNDGKSNLVNTTISRVGSNVLTRHFIKKAGEQVLRAASKEAISNTTRVSGTSHVARNLIKHTAKNCKQLYSAEQMLCSETVCNAAKTAGKSALKRTAVATGSVTFALEAGFAAWQINNLWEQRKEGKIKDRDFKRETTKVIVTVPVSTAATTVGSVIGQAVCPFPVVGALLGGLVGNVTGRLVAGITAGSIFDLWWPR